MADSAGNRESWQRYDLRVNRYGGEGGPGYEDNNDFESDPRCVALWRFGSGGLYSDSVGSNPDWVPRLAFSGPPYSSYGKYTTPVGGGPYIEGSASLLMEHIVGFPGETFALDILNPVGLPTGAFSITAWLRSTASLSFLNVTITKRIQGESTASHGGPAWGLSLSQTSAGVIARSVSDTFNSSFPSVVPGDWYHLLLSVDSNGDVLFQVRDTSGSLVHSDTDNIGGPIQDFGTLLIIGDLSSNGSGTQNVDEIAIFNGALTSAEGLDINRGRYSYP